MLLQNILQAIIGFRISSLHVKITPRQSDTDASPNRPNESPGSRHRGCYFTFPPGALSAVAAGANAEPFHSKHVESV